MEEKRENTMVLFKFDFVRVSDLNYFKFDEHITNKM